MNAIAANLFAVMTIAMVKFDDRKNDKGATMVEYALLVTGIAVVVGIAAATFGGRVGELFGKINLGPTAG